MHFPRGGGHLRKSERIVIGTCHAYFPLYAGKCIYIGASCKISEDIVLNSSLRTQMDTSVWRNGNEFIK